MTARVLAEATLDTADDLFLAGLRRWVAATMEGCTRGAIQEASIVLVELLANAYRHAEPTYAVSLAASRHAVILRVDDGSAPPERPWAVGKGLLIVRGLCPRWGVEPTAAGKRVWAELPVLVAPHAR